ncbi:VOC family protein [Streptomyces sp. NPDC004980]
MAVRFYHLVVDAHDPPSLARFWCGVLDWLVLFEDEDEDGDEVVIGADEFAMPGMCFLRVPEEKTVKNRLHIDLAPDDQAAEVERIVALGARRVDVGQGEDVTWVVLADPEGNEFCVLRPKKSLVD